MAPEERPPDPMHDEKRLASARELGVDTVSGGVQGAPVACQHVACSRATTCLYRDQGAGLPAPQVQANVYF